MCNPNTKMSDCEKSTSHYTRAAFSGKSKTRILSQSYQNGHQIALDSVLELNRCNCSFRVAQSSASEGRVLEVIGCCYQDSIVIGEQVVCASRRVSNAEVQPIVRRISTHTTVHGDVWWRKPSNSNLSSPSGLSPLPPLPPLPNRALHWRRRPLPYLRKAPPRL